MPSLGTTKVKDLTCFIFGIL